MATVAVIELLEIALEVAEGAELASEAVVEAAIESTEAALEATEDAMVDDFSMISTTATTLSNTVGDGAGFAESVGEIYGDSMQDAINEGVDVCTLPSLLPSLALNPFGNSCDNISNATEEIIKLETFSSNLVENATDEAAADAVENSLTEVAETATPSNTTAELEDTINNAKDEIVNAIKDAKPSFLSKWGKWIFLGILALSGAIAGVIYKIYTSINQGKASGDIEDCQTAAVKNGLTAAQAKAKCYPVKCQQTGQTIQALNSDIPYISIACAFIVTFLLFTGKLFSGFAIILGIAVILILVKWVGPSVLANECYDSIEQKDG